MITNNALVAEKPHRIGVGSGVQRLYKLPNGYGLSAVNNPELHSFPFAWEIAVVKGMNDDGTFEGLTYDTPLTNDVKVFSTEDDTNEFIARAIAWAGE